MPQEKKTRKNGLPQMQTRALVRPDSLNEEARSVEICFTTGERGLRTPYYDEPYYEELEISLTGIRTDRLDKGLSVIDSHRMYNGIEGVYGITSEWRIEGSELIGTVTFADDEESDKVYRKVATGILPHVSLGYIIHRMQRVGEQDGIPIFRAIDWSPTELSIVPVSFETTNGVRSGERSLLHECIIEDNTMPQDKKPDGSPVPVVAPVVAPAPVEQTRVIEPVAPVISESQVRGDLTAFMTASRQAGFDVEHATRAYTEGKKINDYREELLKELSERSLKNAPTVPLVDDKRTDHAQAKRDDLGSAIATRITGNRKELSDNARAFSQMPIMEAMRHYSMMNGDQNVLGLSSLAFASRALQSTSDLPLILENVMNRELLAAYEETVRTFTAFARRTSVNDFRAKNTYQMGDAPSLLPLGEGGEYKHGKFSESKESYRISTYARKIGFTRQMMINDDLSALQRFPQMFGGAAARLESDIVWGLLLNYDFIAKKAANHRLSDNTALFTLAHGNLLQGAANGLNDVGLSALRKLGRDQKTLDKNFLNVEFNAIAVGSTLETQAQKILNGTIMANTTADVNVFKASSDLIVEPRIEAVPGGDKAFYAMSRQIAAIEYAYLAGNEGVYTEVVESTDIDGTTILARHDFGAGFEDYRGIAKSTGVAA